MIRRFSRYFNIFQSGWFILVGGFGQEVVVTATFSLLNGEINSLRFHSLLYLMYLV